MTRKSSSRSCDTRPASSVLPAGCYKNRNDLTAFTVPSAVETIGSEAFRHCSSLEQVSIPCSVTEIGSRCFEECVALKQFHVAPSNPLYCSSGALLMKNSGRVLVCAPSASASFIVPEGIEIIEDLAFSRCKSLCELSLPATLHYIGSSAFARCTGLQSLTIPGSCRDVADHCFENCTSLKDITFEEGVQNIGAHCFDGCTSLQTVTLPFSIQRICEPLVQQCHATFVVHDQSRALDLIRKQGLNYRIR